MGINMKKTALIMAGGKGERFWPKSRMNLPKQFLSLTDDGKTMIQLTVERISSIVDIKDVYVATNQLYKNLVLEQLQGIPEENILCEPVGKNTAPCIGLGAIHAHVHHDDAIMIVLPSDHLIKNQKVFVETLKQACDVAQEGENLVTIGIKPNYPETGYGYIHYDKQSRLLSANAVKKFVEKPNEELAKQYVESGEYLWNSGMFVWKVSTILHNYEELMPDIYKGLCTIQKSIGTNSYTETLNKEFQAFRSESVDYGIMEHAKNIYSIPGDFGWDDVGSWLAVGRIKENDIKGNVLNGNIVAVDTKDCIIEGQDKLIATVGLCDIVIVDTKDALLVCDKKSTGNIKNILSQLRDLEKTCYL